MSRNGDNPASETAGETESEQPDLKVLRFNAKRVVTHLVNDMIRSVAADKVENISDKVERLNCLFTDFENVCSDYELGIEDETELDRCDSYFLEVQSNHIKVLEHAKCAIGPFPAHKTATD